MVFTYRVVRASSKSLMPYSASVFLVDSVVLGPNSVYRIDHFHICVAVDCIFMYRADKNHLQNIIISKKVSESS